MYVQLITFNLEGIDEEEYLDTAHRLAARIADQPGLLAKLWLENEGGNRYGGVYFWDDLESMERFSRSDLFEGRVPEFSNLSVEEFGVLENLTALTQPMLEVLEPKGTTRPATGVPSMLTVPRKRTPPTRAAAPRKSSPKKRKPPARKA
jgi:heme-degrading monooxygenase HmoA